MENQQQAPGPWEADGQRIYGADGSLVATVAYCRDHETEVANTSLIAAAPELLEVAHGILAADMLQYLPAEYIAKARAAIAKATGSEA